MKGRHENHGRSSHNSSCPSGSTAPARKRGALGTVRADHRRGGDRRRVDRVGRNGRRGESAENSIRALKPYLLGHDPLQFEQLYWKICNPTASLYNNRTQLHAAVEFACMDLAGKKLGVRACDLLGGALREQIPFASYLFYRYADPQTGLGGEETAHQMLATAKKLKSKYGFRTHKLKGGVFPPQHDLEVYLSLAAEFPEDSFRLDPNAARSVEESVRIGRAIEKVRNDYYEDPCWGLEGMRRVRSTFWGGLRQAWKAGIVCEKFQRGISVHSSGELGIQLATMLHLGAALPNLTFAADAHYHHLTGDILKGGKMKYVDGKMAVPKGNGLGIELDAEKVSEYAEFYRRTSGYAYDRDPQRPEWFAIIPETRFAQPAGAAKKKENHR